MMDTESIITGLILLDVTATLTGNYLLWNAVNKVSTRITILETQHAHNHGVKS